jgi:hypothetical protein
MIRRGWRVLLLACRGRSARGVADVVAASYGRRLATSTSMTFLDQAGRERDEFLNQGVIDLERRSKETVRSTATSTSAGGDLLEWLELSGGGFSLAR